MGLREFLSQAWLEESNVVPRMFTDAMREFERGPSFDALADMNRANLRGSQQLQTVLARLSEGYYEPEP